MMQNETRERLIELLQEYTDNNNGGGSNHGRADHLIEHGVTVQKCGHWVSLTDCSNAGVYCSVCHKKVYKEDYAWCNRKNKLHSEYCPNCGAKMMPNRRKENDYENRN